MQYSIYYSLRTLLPRRWMIGLRRKHAAHIKSRYSENWPIDPRSTSPPQGWSGWPSGKQFALVLTHDVESARGLGKCLELAELEEHYGFRSSFNFVPKGYIVPQSLRRELTARGFEIGIHGFDHKNNFFKRGKRFKQQVCEINKIAKEWGCTGFRAPSMYHDLELIHHLDIEYDASTFDTDPFEPQPDGMGTIFPFWVPGETGAKGYVELPYTLPQDFLLHILLKNRSIDVWKNKLDWIAGHGGMALSITHPDYMSFGGRPRYDEYPVRFYEEFLAYIKSRYEGCYWHILARDMARYWRAHFAAAGGVPRKSCHIGMPVYSFYEMDNRVMRYAEALEKRRDEVEVIALGRKGESRREVIRGVMLHRVQSRDFREKSSLTYLLRLLLFFLRSFSHLTITHLMKPYDLIHVHSVPDFEVFAAAVPKLLGARVILDIHDIVPEFYASKFLKDKKSLTFKALAYIERLSCRFSDHIIVSNHIWRTTLVSRSVDEDKCSVIMNYPDESIFCPRARTRENGKFVMMYPGTLSHHQGLDIAIDAFSRIKDEVPNAEFHIYGQGQERDNICNIVQELGLEDRVFVKDAVPIHQVAALMADADIGIIPKRDEPFSGEAFSTKILEFMSMNIPVIVSRTKIDNFYFDESVVKYFQPEDVDDLARCMFELIKNAEMREQLVRNAQRFVDDFRWESKRGEYFALVDALLLAKTSKK